MVSQLTYDEDGDPKEDEDNRAERQVLLEPVDLLLVVGPVVQEHIEGKGVIKSGCNYS